MLSHIATNVGHWDSKKANLCLEDFKAQVLDFCLYSSLSHSASHSFLKARIADTREKGDD
jgi:hypothetical protein